MIVIQNFRPDAVIIGYWRELLDIPQDSELFNPEYMEGIQ